MPRGTLLNEEEMGRIRAYNEAGFNISQISRKVGRTRCVISNFLKDPEKYGINRSSGRKPKLDDRDKRRIIKRTSNSFESCSTLTACCSKRVSRMTVWRVLQSFENIVRGVLKMAPFLKPCHKIARLQFVENNLERNWASVCYFNFILITRLCATVFV